MRVNIHINTCPQIYSVYISLIICSGKNLLDKFLPVRSVIIFITQKHTVFVVWFFLFTFWPPLLISSIPYPCLQQLPICSQYLGASFPFLGPTCKRDYMVLSFWLFSLSTMPLRSIHVVNVKISIFLWLRNIPLYIYMQQSLSTHPSWTLNVASTLSL